MDLFGVWGFGQDLLINNKETQTGRATNLLTVPHPGVPPSLVQMGTGPVSEAKVPPRKVEGSAPSSSRAAPLGSWSAWLSHGGEEIVTGDRELQDERSGDSISPLPPPKAVSTPTPTPTISGRPVCGERVADSLSLHDGRACLLRPSGGQPHTPTDHGQHVTSALASAPSFRLTPDRALQASSAGWGKAGPPHRHSESQTTITRVESSGGKGTGLWFPVGGGVGGGAGRRAGKLTERMRIGSLLFSHPLSTTAASGRRAT